MESFVDLMTDNEDTMMETIAQMASDRAKELKAELAEKNEKKRKRNKKEKEMVIAAPVMAKGITMEQAVSATEKQIDDMQTTKSNWYAFAIAALGPEEVSVDDALHKMGLDRKNKMTGKYTKQQEDAGEVE